MNWQEQLITIYLQVCKGFEEGLWCYTQRMTNHADLSFTDEEVVSVYLFGVIDGRRRVKDIYTYADRHLREWFPKLPGYAAYNHRLNQVSNVFAPLLENLVQAHQAILGVNSWLIDSFPIALAKQGHRFGAKVAPEIASGGYCSTKKLYYYGVKAHMVGLRQPGTLPFPVCIGITGADCHDGPVFDQIRDELNDSEGYGDMAYDRPDAEQVEALQNIRVLTPVKRERGQKYLDARDQLLSTAVSRVRQPIESLFAWLEEKTGIESAGKVRSYNGLMVHIFGKLAAAIFFWIFIRTSF